MLRVWSLCEFIGSAHTGSCVGLKHAGNVPREPSQNSWPCSWQLETDVPSTHQTCDSYQGALGLPLLAAGCIDGLGMILTRELMAS